MLAFRYRGTIIRTSAFKLLFLGVLTVSMVMFMRLQGVFLAMPVSEDKQPFGSVFPQQHERHHIYSVIFTAAPRDKDSSNERTSKAFATSNLVLPSIELQTTETPINIDKVRHFIQLSNSQQRIKNLDQFPGALTDDSMIIIVQVHNRPDYFSHLLKSLSRARGIGNALLVISHDYYSDFINKMVDAVKFCKVS